MSINYILVYQLAVNMGTSLKMIEVNKLALEVSPGDGISICKSQSEVQHINLKSHKELCEMTEKYCKNVYMFGMNEEVLHTGYAPMCNYI